MRIERNEPGGKVEAEPAQRAQRVQQDQNVSARRTQAHTETLNRSDTARDVGITRSQVPAREARRIDRANVSEVDNNAEPPRQDDGVGGNVDVVA